MTEEEGGPFGTPPDVDVSFSTSLTVSDVDQPHDAYVPLQTSLTVGDRFDADSGVLALDHWRR